MLGIFLIDKPLGISSHDATARLRRKFGIRRVGHAGTLDPLATGLLVTAIGPATRFLQYLPLEPKEYVATIEFGKATTTQDAEGAVTAERPVPADLQAALAQIIPQYLGLIQQVPPMYSAVKRGGKPLYAYARQGVEVEREARSVHIGDIEVLDVTAPRATVRVECSGGTYIRTLANDIGAAMGCGAYLAGLRRTRVGDFRIEDSHSLDEVEPADLLSLRDALGGSIPMAELDDAQAAAIRQGRTVIVKGAWEGKVAVLDPGGQVLGMAQAHGSALKPECVLPIEVSSAL